MSTVNQVGNVILSYIDRWQMVYYLTEGLNFTKNKSEACLFYILNSTNTAIKNGDHVTINTGNKVLVIDNSKILLVDRNIAYRYKNNFLIADGDSNNNNEITFNSKIYLIIDHEEKIALRFYYSLNLGEQEEDIPKMICGSYGEGREIGIDVFQFILSPATVVGTESPSLKVADNVNKDVVAKTSTTLSDNYKSIILLIIILMILIIVIILTNKKVF